MVSPELLRRYPFFANFTHEQLVSLAQIADEISVEEGYHFFQEGDKLYDFYLVLEGTVSISISIPRQHVEHPLSEQITRDLKTREVSISAVGEGEIFGWSALVPPHETTASARANTICRVLIFDCEALLEIFEDDYQFGYMMLQKAAQVIRSRLRDTRIEVLADIMVKAGEL